jgi:hypothetical protein
MEEWKDGRVEGWKDGMFGVWSLEFGAAFAVAVRSHVAPRHQHNGKLKFQCDL